MSRSIFRILGILFWVVLLVGGLTAWQSSRDGLADRAGVSLVRYFGRAATKVSALDPSAQLQARDPIYFQDTDGNWRQIGYVESTSGEVDKPIVLFWYSQDVAPDQCRLVQYQNRGQLDDVVATLLNSDKQAQIRRRLTAAMRLYGDDLTALFAPLVETGLRRSLPVIEEEFRRALNRHRGEIERLAQRWNDAVVGERLLPLVRREILPIVRTYGQPLADQIGRELWDRASLWRFTWRAIYDSSPLPRKDLVQQEWNRFVAEHAVPVFEERKDDMVGVVQRIVSEVAASKAVRREMAAVANDVATDSDARRLVQLILKEVLVENKRLREVWRSVWVSEQALRALNMAGDRLESVVRGIGDDLFGTREDGINPDFARVLRHQILRKDGRWIVAVRIENASPPPVKTITVSRESMPYPVVYMAHRDGREEGGE